MSEQTQKTSKRSRKNQSVSDFKTTEAQENYLINLAFKLAEKKLKDGTASSQIITTLLNMRTEKAELEKEKLKSDLEVANAKIENLKRQTSSEELMKRAIDAFKRYSGEADEEDYDDD